MIAIDTNVLVRYLVRDDPQQAERARRLLQSELTAEQPGFVGLATIVELAWVLGKVYKQSPATLRLIFRQLIAAPQLVIEETALIERALALELRDLADAIIHETGKKAGCAKTLTFDRSFARLKGVELLDA